MSDVLLTDEQKHVVAIEQLLVKAHLEGWTYRRTSTAILDAATPAPAPIGYWSVSGDMTAELWQAIRPALETATANGEQIVVREGLTMRWHPATPAPAPLDVEALRKALEHYDVVDYHHDPHGVTMKDPATPIAAEYARLTARAAATEDADAE